MHTLNHIHLFDFCNYSIELCVCVHLCTCVCVCVNIVEDDFSLRGGKHHVYTQFHPFI